MITTSVALPERVDGLVLVDVQHGFRTTETEHAIEGILARAQAADRQGIPIVMTRFINDSRSLFRTELSYENCSEADDSSRLIDELQHLYSRVPVIPKLGYAAKGRLAAKCRELAITRPMVIGVDTESGVLACANELFDHGIVPIIDTEACASTSGREMHAAGVSVMGKLFGRAAII